MKTLLLNSDMGPLRVLNWRKAFALVFKNTAYQVESYPKIIKDSTGKQYHIPSVISLKKYIKVPHIKPALTKRNLLIRDNYKCQYCGIALTSESITVDHVLPKSKCKGNPTTWNNVVAACWKCNSKRGNDETIRPKTVPSFPNSRILLKRSILMDNTNPEWAKYLS